MGKTRTALTFIHKAATMTTGPYQPTVILCPAHTVSIWFQEAKSFGTGLQVIILYSSSKAVSDIDQRRATVDTLDDLRRCLGSLNLADPQVARTVVISSYATWSRKVTAFRLVGGDDEQENAIDEVKGEEATGQKGKRQYFSHLAGHFSRIICDEAHVLKNIATQTHQGIKTAAAMAIARVHRPIAQHAGGHVRIRRGQCSTNEYKGLKMILTNREGSRS